MSTKWGMAGAWLGHGGALARAWRGCGGCMATQAWWGRKKTTVVYVRHRGAVVRAATGLSGPGDLVHWMRQSLISRLSQRNQRGRSYVAASIIVPFVSVHWPFVAVGLPLVMFLVTLASFGSSVACRHLADELRFL